ncbi:MAG: hypothetical protein E6J75_12830 [Deltaproteobacteria bacterium]|nr:MAG: hypothetical protein E6J75_12830 [Deltaproteobacteria bacterium]
MQGMVDASLHVEGTARPPGASPEAPFALHTAIANGALVDRAGDAALHVDIGRATAQVTAVTSDGCSTASTSPR